MSRFYGFLSIEKWEARKLSKRLSSASHSFNLAPNAVPEDSVDDATANASLNITTEAPGHMRSPLTTEDRPSKASNQLLLTSNSLNLAPNVMFEDLVDDANGPLGTATKVPGHMRSPLTIEDRPSKASNQLLLTSNSLILAPKVVPEDSVGDASAYVNAPLGIATKAPGHMRSPFERKDPVRQKPLETPSKGQTVTRTFIDAHEALHPSSPLKSKRYLFGSGLGEVLLDGVSFGTGDQSSTLIPSPSTFTPLKSPKDSPIAHRSSKSVRKKDPKKQRGTKTESTGQKRCRPGLKYNFEAHLSLEDYQRLKSSKYSRDRRVLPIVKKPECNGYVDILIRYKSQVMASTVEDKAFEAQKGYLHSPRKRLSWILDEFPNVESDFEENEHMIKADEEFDEAENTPKSALLKESRSKRGKKDNKKRKTSGMINVEANDYNHKKLKSENLPENEFKVTYRGLDTPYDEDFD